MTLAPSTIRTFNRYELKYILSTEFAEKMQTGLGQYLLPDENGNERGDYVLSSLYYDTEDFRFYWEKMEGIKFRRKLRLRVYETAEQLTPDSTVFLEIKQRLDKIVQKRRVALTLEEANLFYSQGAIPSRTSATDQAYLEEMWHMLKSYQLKPQCITSYQRRAFNGTERDPGLRVTFDTNLRYRRHDLDLASKKIGAFMLPADQCVMEIKVNDRIPYWLTQFVADHNIRLMRISKYCTSLEQAEAVPRNHHQFIS
jgi:hypothetical protein